jgi:hypothetical protein
MRPLAGEPVIPWAFSGEKKDLAGMTNYGTAQKAGSQHIQQIPDK